MPLKQVDLDGVPLTGDDIDGMPSKFACMRDVRVACTHIFCSFLFYYFIVGVISLFDFTNLQ